MVECARRRRGNTAGPAPDPSHRPDSEETRPMASRFAHELSRRVLTLDGAMGTSIYAHDLDLEKDYCGCENCTDILVKTRPDVIQEIHESFLRVGA
ncbi:MAG: hypothetical protein EA380_12050, partial [Phycisphaeraceae bacterium]